MRRRSRIAEVISLSATWWATWRGVQPSTPLSRSRSGRARMAASSTDGPSRYFSISWRRVSASILETLNRSDRAAIPDVHGSVPAGGGVLIGSHLLVGQGVGPGGIGGGGGEDDAEHVSVEVDERAARVPGLDPGTTRGGR